MWIDFNEGDADKWQNKIQSKLKKKKKKYYGERARNCLIRILMGFSQYINVCLRLLRTRLSRGKSFQDLCDFTVDNR